MEEREGQNLVRVATASNPVQAHIWEQALEGEGIRCKAVGDFLDAGVGDIPGMRAELWVRQKDLEAARDILQRTEEDRTEEAELEE